MPENLTTETEEKELKIDIKTDNSDLIDFFNKKEELEKQDHQLQTEKEKELIKTEEEKQLELQELEETQEEYQRNFDDSILSYLEDLKNYNNLQVEELKIIKEETILLNENITTIIGYFHISIVLFLGIVISLIIYKVVNFFLY